MVSTEQSAHHKISMLKSTTKQHTSRIGIQDLHVRSTMAETSNSIIDNGVEFLTTQLLRERVAAASTEDS